MRVVKIFVVYSIVLFIVLMLVSGKNSGAAQQTYSDSVQYYRTQLVNSRAQVAELERSVKSKHVKIVCLVICIVSYSAYRLYRIRYVYK